MKQKGRRHSPAAFSVLVRGTRLELAWYNHKPLKRARLPIPPSSQKRHGFMSADIILP